MADKEFEQITAVIVCGHDHLIPTDSDLIAIASSNHILRRTIHVAPDGLQIQFPELERSHIAYYIHDCRRDPAVIGQFVEFYIKPRAICIPIFYLSNVTWE